MNDDNPLNKIRRWSEMFAWQHPVEMRKAKQQSIRSPNLTFEHHLAKQSYNTQIFYEHFWLNDFEADKQLVSLVDIREWKSTAEGHLTATLVQWERSKISTILDSRFSRSLLTLSRIWMFISSALSRWRNFQKFKQMLVWKNWLCI